MAGGVDYVLATRKRKKRDRRKGPEESTVGYIRQAAEGTTRIHGLHEGVKERTKDQHASAARATNLVGNCRRLFVCVTLTDVN
jgi:ribosomal protein S15P/S13E